MYLSLSSEKNYIVGPVTFSWYILNMFAVIYYHILITIILIKHLKNNSYVNIV